MSIHFTELLVILFVALLVIKPERLPEVAMTLGRLTKRMRDFVGKIKQELTYHE